MPSALDALIKPFSRRTFLARHWERKPLLIRRRRLPQSLALLCAADLDALARHATRYDGALLRIVKREGSHLEESSPELGRAGHPDPIHAYRALSEGRTLIFNALDRRWPSISVFCRSLEEDLGHRVGANAYFTPRASQGFLPHADDHDVFVLQLEGRKHWKVYEPKVKLPLRSSAGAIPHELGERAVLDAELSPGDVLYVPRGFIHEGFTSDSRSLHLTIGVHVLRVIDLLKETLDVEAERDIRLRRAVSLSSKATPTSIKLSGISIARARTRLRVRFLEQTEPVLDSHLSRIASAGKMTLQTIVQRRPGAPPFVSLSDDDASIHFSGNFVKGPAMIAEALQFLAKRRQFSVRELPGLDDQSKLVLVNRLVREGLLSAPPA